MIYAEGFSTYWAVRVMKADVDIGGVNMHSCIGSDLSVEIIGSSIAAQSAVGSSVVLVLDAMAVAWKGIQGGK